MTDTDDLADRPRDEKAVMLLGWGQALRALAVANARADAAEAETIAALKMHEVQYLRAEREASARFAAEADRDRHHTTLTTLVEGVEKLVRWAESYRMHHVAIALRELLPADAAWDAAGDTARAALAPTVTELKASAHDLVDRMLSATEAVSSDD